MKANGFYSDVLDGIWGPNTNQADADFVARSAAIGRDMGTFDSRSEGNIITLIPKAQVEARRFLQLVGQVDVRIISGTRTYDEQDILFAQGRTRPGKIVTNARGGQSNHNFGLAWDIGIFNSGVYSENDQDYIPLANSILPQMNTIEWGGNWHSIVDNPHFQLRSVSDDVTVIRGLFENGEVYA